MARAMTDLGDELLLAREQLVEVGEHGALLEVRALVLLDVGLRRARGPRGNVRERARARENKRRRSDAAARAVRSATPHAGPGARKKKTKRKGTRRKEDEKKEKGGGAKEKEEEMKGKKRKRRGKEEARKERIQTTARLLLAQLLGEPLLLRELVRVELVVRLEVGQQLAVAGLPRLLVRQPLELDVRHLYVPRASERASERAMRECGRARENDGRARRRAV